MSRSSGLMILLGLGLPGIIFYSIFLSNWSTPQKKSPVVEITQEFTDFIGDDYRIHRVQRSNSGVQAQIVLSPATSDPKEMHLRGLNAQYDFQSRLGREQNLTIVLGQTDETLFFESLALIFFSSSTQQSRFQRITGNQ